MVRHASPTPGPRPVPERRAACLEREGPALCRSLVATVWAVSPVRRCSRSACGKTAVATLTYVYADSTAVLGPLATYAEPHCYDLCAAHSQRLTAPRGWEVLRLAPDPGHPGAEHRRPRGARRRRARGGPTRPGPAPGHRCAARRPGRGGPARSPAGAARRLLTPAATPTRSGDQPVRYAPESPED